MALSLEQQQAIAMANARKRMAEASQAPEAPPVEQVPLSIADQFQAIDQPRQALSTEPVQRPSANIQLSDTDIEELTEIGSAPELNRFDTTAFKSSLAASLMSNPNELAQSLKNINPDSEVLVGADGSLRVKFPSGEYALNLPGISGQDIVQFGTRMGAFMVPGGGQGTSIRTLGKEALKAVGVEGVLQGAEEGLGGEFDKAPIVAAGVAAPIGQALPDWFGSAVQGVRNKGAKAVLKQSAPTVQALKEAAGNIYDQVDDIGVRVSPSAYQSMIDSIESAMTKKGMRESLTPQAFNMLKELRKEPLENLTVSNMVTMREIASGVKGIKTDAREANLGRIATDKIDDFINNIDKYVANPKNLKVNGQPVGEALKDARNLWGRARRSELVQQTIKVAEETWPSGIDKGLQTQFNNLHRQILKGKLTGFTKNEVEAIKSIANREPLHKMAFALGRLGVPADQATNTLMLTLVGGLGGTYAAGTTGGLGAMAAIAGGVGIPTIFRQASTRMMRENVRLADDIVRASDDGLKVIKAYLKNTPKKQRNPAEISALLLSSGAKPDALKNTGNKLIDDAIFGFKTALATEAAQTAEQEQ